jgi:hypothetical protein
VAREKHVREEIDGNPTLDLPNRPRPEGSPGLEESAGRRPRSRGNRSDPGRKKDERLNPRLPDSGIPSLGGVGVYGEFLVAQRADGETEVVERKKKELATLICD